MHSPDVGEQMEIACGFVGGSSTWLTWAKTAKINATKRNLGTLKSDHNYFMRLDPKESPSKIYIVKDIEDIAGQIGTFGCTTYSWTLSSAWDY